MVLVEGPAGLSANRSSGQVMKRIALKMHARGLISDTPKLQPTTSAGGKPILAASTSQSAQNVATTLRGTVSTLKPKATSATGTVPDVTGYDIQSAIKILETNGLNVQVAGTGRVVRQSIAPGTPIKRRQKIVLTLKV